MRTYENTCADCGDTVAAMSEPEPGSSLCYSCATGTLETRLVFVNLDTDTVEDLAHDVFVIDPNATTISDADREILETADHYGAFTDDAREIVRRIGVPFADLWAAYEWRRAFDRGVTDANLSTGVTYGTPDSPLSVAYDMGRNYGERAGDGWRFDGDAWHHCDRPAHWDGDDVVCSRCQETMSDDEQDYDNRHRCTDCGVTGGGVVGGLCQDCDGERQRADDGWRWLRGGGWNHCDRPGDYDDDGVTCRVCHRFMTWEQADVRMAE